jgi:molybdopterin molybdotransferase
MQLLSYDDALILLKDLPIEAKRLTVSVTEAVGRVLARDVCAYRDQPPFDRGTMDGFALLPGKELSFRVVGTVLAGERRDESLAAGDAVAIMTGAPVPAGCCVVPVENTERDGERLIIEEGYELRVGRNVAPRGEDARRGDLVLQAGTRLSAAGVAAAAMAGARELQVYEPPRLGICTTGDEVGSDGPAGVADCNGPLLSALVQTLGVSAERSHARDEAQHLKATLQRLADQSDLVVTVGGVSMGERDLVPGVAMELGFEVVLHKVAMQPGKPVLLAQRSDGKILLGLPGNPVSVLVTAHLFLAPLLGRFMGDWKPAWMKRPLALDYQHRGKRRLFLPARLDRAGLHPVAWNGSGDLYSATAADGLVDLAAGGSWSQGTLLRFLPYLGQGVGEHSVMPARVGGDSACC